MRFFTDDTRFFTAVISRIRRSLLLAEYLQVPKYQTAAAYLRRAISENGIIAKDLDQVDGLREAYKSGWLHAEYVEQEATTVYGFPSAVHFKYLAPLQTQSRY